MALITAQSIPEDAWDCEAWMTWHKKLEGYYDLDKANQVWLAGWNEQGIWDSQINWCKYSKEFVNYFDSKGMDASYGVARIVTGATGGAVSAIEGIAKTLGISAKLLPFVLVFLVGLGGWGIYRIVRKRTA